MPLRRTNSLSTSSTIWIISQLYNKHPNGIKHLAVLLFTTPLQFAHDCGRDKDIRRNLFRFCSGRVVAYWFFRRMVQTMKFLAFNSFPWVARYYTTSDADNYARHYAPNRVAVLINSPSSQTLIESTVREQVKSLDEVWCLGEAAWELKA